ncbi:MAG TPA: hypothetical protein VJ777_21220 [Mycobacterium sp.]|nr:hypothetical protein [Mycobacterium sp.]
MSTDPWVGKNWEDVQIPRDGMNRPLIMNPEGTKRVAYRRTTTFVGALEDRYNLEQWKLRQACWGLGQRPDLVLKAASVHIEDKKALDEVAKDAMEYAESSAKATKGTALHKLCERLDRGQPLGKIPPPHDADIRAYEQCMKRYGLTHKAIETFRVHDDWKVAGTADRISEMDGDNFIADIKTGDIERIHKIAMQLAMYRASRPYDIATNQRFDDPYPISNNRGLVIHLPSGSGECFLHWVDIEKGRRGLQACYQVFDFRGIKRKDLTWPVADQHELPVNTGHLDYEAMVLSCNTVDELRDLYFEAQVNNADSEDFVRAVRARKAILLQQQGGDE